MVFGNANIYLINVFIVSSPTLGPFNVKRAVSLSSAYKLSYCSGSELFVQMLLLTEVHYYVLYIVALRTFLLSITTTIVVLKNGNVYLAKYLPLKTREREVTWAGLASPVSKLIWLWSHCLDAEAGLDNGSTSRTINYYLKCCKTNSINQTVCSFCNNATLSKIEWYQTDHF